MPRVALPIFQSRIAPVFDSAIRILLIDIEQQRVLARSEFNIENLSASERVATLKRADVNTLICAGISNVVHTMLETEGIGVNPGIIGQVEEVITAHLHDRLDDPRFRMPGHGRPSVDDPQQAKGTASDNSRGKPISKPHHHRQTRG